MLPALKVIFFAFVFYFVSIAQSAELKSDHQTIRNLGMGGVRVATPHTPEAQAWNPAYLGYSSGLNVKLFDAGAGLNGLQAFNSFSNVDWAAGPGAWGDIYGQPLWLGASGMGAFTFGNFGMYYNRSYDLNVMLRDPTLPVLDTSYFESDFYHMGAGFEVLPGLALGASIKRVVRKGGDQTIGTTTLTDPDFTNDLQNNLISSFTDEGIATAIDLGVAYKLKVPFNPTVSLAWQDAAVTSFKMSNPSSPSQTIRENMTMAVTFEQDLPLMGLAGGIELRHLRRDDEQLGKKLHMGMEFQFLFADFRAGLYQGYVSYGLGFDMWLFQFDIVSYKVEQGVYPGQTPQERIMAAINMNLSFDPDLNFRSLGGERRKLKRRR